jgi:FKBP-type peptidyl-prolyl cis-trans isomerase SlyD
VVGRLINAIRKNNPREKIKMLQKNDFIEIEYTAKTKNDGIIFDTTDEKIAKENKLDQENTPYGPIIICIGQNQVIAGLDKDLEGKEAGKEYTITLQPEDAFGKKSAKLVQLIGTRKFIEQQIAPQPGLQVNIDGMMVTIKTVSGGRVLVDFNHPLSGKVIEYSLKINRKVEDDLEKLKGYLKLGTGIKEIKAEIKEGKARVELPMELEKEIKEDLSRHIIEIIPSIKEIDFVREEKKEEEKKPSEAKKEESTKK